MKLGENNYHMRLSFSPSFMKIGQKMWIFYQWPIFERGPFFLTQTLAWICLMAALKPSEFRTVLVAGRQICIEEEKMPLVTLRGQNTLKILLMYIQV